MRDLKQEQKQLYEEVKEAGLKPSLKVEHHKKGKILFIPVFQDEYFILSEDDKVAIRVDRLSAEAFLLLLLQDA